MSIFNIKMDVTLLVIVLICLTMFAISGVEKIQNFDSTVSSVGDKLTRISSQDIIKGIVIAVIILEILAPLIIAFSVLTERAKTLAVLSALGLAIFTAIATYLYHFPPTGKAYYPFISNVTTFGCMLLIAYTINKSD